MKQANIAHGPQQVNNGADADGSAHVHGHAHAEKSAPEQNKLLEADHGQPGGRMDTRAAQAAERSSQTVEAIEEVNRA